GISLLAGLLPWMILCFLSNGSPIFPLFPGGNNAAFNPRSLDVPLYTRLLPAIQMILHPALLTLLLCPLALPDWRRALAARSVAVAGFLASLALACSITLAPDDTTVPRYVQPLLLAGALAALMTAAVSPRGRVMAWAMTLLL